jgi:ABC-type enterochelin transport system permease subunit
MTARGNPENITKAKGIMEGAVIGLVIVMASYAISRFIFQSITTGKADLTPPIVNNSPSST